MELKDPFREQLFVVCYSREDWSQSHWMGIQAKELQNILTSDLHSNWWASIDDLLDNNRRPLVTSISKWINSGSLVSFLDVVFLYAGAFSITSMGTMFVYSFSCK